MQMHGISAIHTQMITISLLLPLLTINLIVNGGRRREVGILLLLSHHRHRHLEPCSPPLVLSPHQTSGVAVTFIISPGSCHQIYHPLQQFAYLGERSVLLPKVHIFSRVTCRRRSSRGLIEWHGAFFNSTQQFANPSSADTPSSWFLMDTNLDVFSSRQ